jgi:hypothetical protein
VHIKFCSGILKVRGHLKTRAQIGNNVRMDVKETECEDVDWVSLTHAVRWPGYLRTSGNYKAPHYSLFVVTSCYFSRWSKYSLLYLLSVPQDTFPIQESGVKFHTDINTRYVPILKSRKGKVIPFLK